MTYLEIAAGTAINTHLSAVLMIPLADFMLVCNQRPPDWEEILAYFRGSELQNYFTKILENNLHAIIKPQYVDHIPKAVRGVVGEVLDSKDQRDVKAELMELLDLEPVSSACILVGV